MSNVTTSPPTELPQHLQAAVETKSYQNEAKAFSLRDDLDKLTDFDSKLEESSASWTSKKARQDLGCLGWGLALLGILIGSSHLPPIVSATLVTIVIAGTFFNLRKGRQIQAEIAALEALNIPAERYQLSGILLTLLAADAGQDANFNLQLDLKPHDDESAKTGEGKVSYWNVDYFQQPWLQLSGRLLDGTKLDLVLTEKQQNRHRTKRSASGKIKHKSKTKSSSLISIKARFKPKSIETQAGREDSIGAAVNVAGAEVKKVQCSEGMLQVILKFPDSLWGGSMQNASGRREYELLADHGMGRVASSLIQVFNYLNTQRVK